MGDGIINPFDKPKPVESKDIVQGKSCMFAFGVIPVPDPIHGIQPAGVHAPCKRSCQLFDAASDGCSITVAIQEVRAFVRSRAAAP